MKYYRLTQTPDSRYATMTEHVDGEFVLREDHNNAIADERQLTMSTEIIERIRREDND